MPLCALMYCVQKQLYAGMNTGNEFCSAASLCQPFMQQTLYICCMVSDRVQTQQWIKYKYVISAFLHMIMLNVCEYLEQWHLQSPPILSPLSLPEHMMLLPSGQVLRHSWLPHLNERELRPSGHTISIIIL